MNDTTIAGFAAAFAVPPIAEQERMVEALLFASRTPLTGRELEERLPDFRHPLSLHVNGCPNSCARIQTADIGLKGQILTGADGQPEFGFQVHLGGGLASAEREDAGLGRTVRGLKVSAEDLPEYVERVVRRFADDAESGEDHQDQSQPGDRHAKVRGLPLPQGQGIQAAGVE